MKWRIAKKLHKVAVAGLDPDEYRRRVPKGRERRAAKRWRKYWRRFRTNGFWDLRGYWLPITRIILNNSLKDLKEIPDGRFLETVYTSR